MRVLAGDSQATVANSAEISNQASEAIDAINEKIKNIYDAVNDSHTEINNVYKEMRELLGE